MVKLVFRVLGSKDSFILPVSVILMIKIEQKKQKQCVLSQFPSENSNAISFSWMWGRRRNWGQSTAEEEGKRGGRRKGNCGRRCSLLEEEGRRDKQGRRGDDAP